MLPDIFLLKKTQKHVYDYSNFLEEENISSSMLLIYDRHFIFFFIYYIRYIYEYLLKSVDKKLFSHVIDTI